MPEDSPDCLVSLTEVSAMGSVPMCQSTQHRACQAGTDRNIQCLGVAVPGSTDLQPSASTAAWSSSHSQVFVRHIQAAWGGEIHSVARVETMLPRVLVDSSGHLVIIAHGPEVTQYVPRNCWDPE